MIIRPAEASDIIALEASHLRLTRPAIHYGWLLAQIALGNAWALVERGESAESEEPIAVGGAVVIPDRPAEAWFLAPGAGVAGHRLLAIVRLARVILGTLARDHEPGVVCLVDRTNEAGARLAELIGFHASGEDLAGAQIWKFDVESGNSSARRRRLDGRPQPDEEGG